MQLQLVLQFLTVTFQNKFCGLGRSRTHFVMRRASVLPGVRPSHVLNEQSTFLEHDKPRHGSHTFPVPCPVCEICSRIPYGITRQPGIGAFRYCYGIRHFLNVGWICNEKRAITPELSLRHSSCYLNSRIFGIKIEHQASGRKCVFRKRIQSASSKVPFPVY